MKSRVSQFTSARSLFQITCFALAITGAVGLGDIWIGPKVSLAVFYLIPISIAAWYANCRVSIVMAMLSSAIMVALEIPTIGVDAGKMTSAWNGFTHLGFFMTTAYLVSSLKTRYEAEKVLARTDQLTGLMNRRAFLEQFEMLFNLASRRDSVLTIAYIDLDNFKQVNDVHGHNVGDQVLQTVATAMKTHSRRTDLVARLGGDEFVIVLPDTGQQAAKVLLAKIHEAIQSSTVKSQRISCSAGVVTFTNMPHTFHEALRFADSLMYQVKEQGKNAVAFSIFDNKDLPTVEAEGSMQ